MRNPLTTKDSKDTQSITKEKSFQESEVRTIEKLKI